MRRGVVENVDDDQLHRILDIGCVRRLGVGARVEYASHWAFVARTYFESPAPAFLLHTSI